MFPSPFAGVAHLEMGWWASWSQGRRAALGHKSSGALPGSLIDLLCDPEKTVPLLWASLLPSVEWETEPGNDIRETRPRPGLFSVPILWASGDHCFCRLILSGAPLSLTSVVSADTSVEARP